MEGKGRACRSSKAGNGLECCTHPGFAQKCALRGYLLWACATAATLLTGWQGTNLAGLQGLDSRPGFEGLRARILKLMCATLNCCSLAYNPGAGMKILVRRTKT
eukprot:1150606-Pelagomonas_calceolata.AAC.1